MDTEEAEVHAEDFNEDDMEEDMQELANLEKVVFGNALKSQEFHTVVTEMKTNVSAEEGVHVDCVNSAVKHDPDNKITSNVNLATLGTSSTEEMIRKAEYCDGDGGLILLSDIATVPVTLNNIQIEFTEDTNLTTGSVPNSIIEDSSKPVPNDQRKVELTAPDKSSKMYNIKGRLVTEPFVLKNLHQSFSDLPIFGIPESMEDIERFQIEKIKDFVGYGLTDDEFEKITEYCSPHHLRTGKELSIPTRVPMSGQDRMRDIPENSDNVVPNEDRKLTINRRFTMRRNVDAYNYYSKSLKYRGCQLWPLDSEIADTTVGTGEPLEPGKDFLVKVRIYRPFPYLVKMKPNRQRHSVFSSEVALCGRTRLTEFRDRFVCANDFGLRTDLSADPEHVSTANAKDMFPSGFLFINNIFYVDTRVGCNVDYSEPIRQWALAKGFGNFERKDMSGVTIQDLVIKLGHPEVYIHQGNCEHLFTFSDVQLVSPTDPLNSCYFPRNTSVSKLQTVYCTTCAEFAAKWVVTGCEKVPFDPAFFCEICFKLYLYKDGEKVCDFQAYSFKGNEINVLKPG